MGNAAISNAEVRGWSRVLEVLASNALVWVDSSEVFQKLFWAKYEHDNETIDAIHQAMNASLRFVPESNTNPDIVMRVENLKRIFPEWSDNPPRYQLVGDDL